MIVSVIIPAAGLGLRLKSSLPKPLVKIGTKPILMHTLEALSKDTRITHISIAVSQGRGNGFEAVLRKNKIRKRITLILGGNTRRESVENCLRALPLETDTVLIHDAVRPFISQELITTLLEEAKSNPAVICGVPVKATIKQVTMTQGLHDRSVFVEKTLKRENIWEIQTPQVFQKSVLLEAYAKYKNTAVTDDASLVEKLGVKIKVVLGSYFNIKITTPEDLVFAKAIVKAGYV